MYEGFRLTGKNAIITGGTRGIGLAIAKGFIDCGAHVTVCSRKQQNVDAALSQFDTRSDKVQGLVAHVGKPNDLKNLVEVSEQRFGPINVLVNNAGTNPYVGPIVEADAGAWDKTLEVNLKGPFMLSQICAKKMTGSSGGSIINISSVAGLMASPQQGIYSVSKAALIMLTQVMARELGQQNVRVNCICPGLIKTELSRAMWSNPELEKATVRAKALGRIGEPSEIVGAAIYLASDASSFTTGAVLQVDGGMMI